ncbi:plasminogen-binding protein pgbB [Myxozyma melibiosi]|uniref:Plasminogen-binding protein pgbB n=1 Tax=Myxozyma melibiosi TaxID=54550 RepID=A0ABR1F0L5_9ASCO
MKFSSALAIASALLAASPVLAKTESGKADSIRILSWNLRYDSKSNKITVDETIDSLNATIPNDDEVSYFTNYTEHAWSDRRIGVSNEMLFNKPDVICVQEALHRQVEDLLDLLPGFEYIGVGRDDGNQSGEYEAIFYRTEKIKVLDWSTFWLSDDPFEPSKYPGAGSYRSATVGHLRTKSKSEFTAICTHWDDKSDEQRQLAGSMIRYRGAYEAETTGNPVFAFGDFNSPSTGGDSGGYKIITGESDMLTMNETFVETYNSSISDTFVFKDFLHETDAQFRMGHFATCTGFTEVDTQGSTRVDFQLGGSNGGWSTTAFKVMNEFYDTGYHLSDHRPVISDVIVGYTD